MRWIINLCSLTAGVALILSCTPEPAPSTDPVAELPSSPEQPAANNPAAATRPADRPQDIIREGRIEEGAECPVLRTPNGETYALSLGTADFGPGDYVRIAGELADASFCMQGKGTIIPFRIDSVGPPARDEGANIESVR